MLENNGATIYGLKTISEDNKKQKKDVENLQNDLSVIEKRLDDLEKMINDIMNN